MAPKNIAFIWKKKGSNSCSLLSKLVNPNFIGSRNPKRWVDVLSQAWELESTEIFVYEIHDME